MDCLGLGSSTDSLPLLSPTHHFSFQDTKKKNKEFCFISTLNRGRLNRVIPIIA